MKRVFKRVLSLVIGVLALLFSPPMILLTTILGIVLLVLLVILLPLLPAILTVLKMKRNRKSEPPERVQPDTVKQESALPEAGGTDDETDAEPLHYDTRAEVSGNSVVIFGKRFPLKRPYYYPTGELKSFAIEQTAIHYMGKEIPMCFRMYLYKDGKYHWSGVSGGYTLEHKGQSFSICGGLFFYPSGKLEQFTVSKRTETAFIVDNKKLFLYRDTTVAFYEESGLPKSISLPVARSCFLPEMDDPTEDYNVLEISETGAITGKIMENRPNYDFN